MTIIILLISCIEFVGKEAFAYMSATLAATWLTIVFTVGSFASTFFDIYLYLDIYDSIGNF